MPDEPNANVSFREIGDAIRAAGRICVLSHFRPDGDAIGSQIALGLSLRELGKEVFIVNDDGCPERFQFLPGSELVITPPDDPLEIDLAIACDASNDTRFSERAKHAGSAADRWMNIDHHVSNDRFAELNYVDDQSPATAQILYELLDDQDLPLDSAICANLYVGISTDTGSFQYPATTAKTYRIAAELMDRGIDVGQLNSATYDNQPLRRLHLLRELLNVLKLTCDGRAASWAMTLKMVSDLDIHSEDTESLIDHIRGIRGVMVAAFFEELDDGRCRVSLRSKDARFDVSEICSRFGGGGHRLAAGARIPGPLSEVEEKVLSVIQEVIHANS